MPMQSESNCPISFSYQWSPLDRIDLHVEAPSLTIKEIQSKQLGESSKSIRQRCQQARHKQTQRFSQKPYAYQQCNARMSSQELKTHCYLNETQMQLLHDAMNQLKLSVRAYDRILKVARTIADLDNQMILSKSTYLKPFNIVI